jgi:hypothetical protein
LMAFCNSEADKQAKHLQRKLSIVSSLPPSFSFSTTKATR